MKKLITYAILLAILFLSFEGAKAQSGLSPMVNSRHEYRVTPGNSSNNLSWSISPATGYTINSGANTAKINVTWTTAGTYTLTFTEEETSVTHCSTVKTATVVVSANLFDVSTSSPTTTCNAADGQINYASSTATTAISFTINMETGKPAWSPDWEFSFNLTPVAGATISNVTASSGSISGAGPYTVTGIPSASGTKTMTVNMSVSGNIYSAQTVGFAITSAKELTYNTPDVDNSDWTGTQTINAVPNTSPISAD